MNEANFKKTFDHKVVEEDLAFSVSEDVSTSLLTSDVGQPAALSMDQSSSFASVLSSKKREKEADKCQSAVLETQIKMRDESSLSLDRFHNLFKELKPMTYETSIMSDDEDSIEDLVSSLEAIPSTLVNHRWCFDPISGRRRLNALVISTGINGILNNANAYTGRLDKDRPHTNNLLKVNMSHISSLMTSLVKNQAFQVLSIICLLISSLAHMFPKASGLVHIVTNLDNREIEGFSYSDFPLIEGFHKKYDQGVWREVKKCWGIRNKKWILKCEINLPFDQLPFKTFDLFLIGLLNDLVTDYKKYQNYHGEPNRNDDEIISLDYNNGR